MGLWRERKTLTRTMESQSSGCINQTDYYSVNQGTGSTTRARLLQCEYMQVSSRLALGLQDGKLKGPIFLDFIPGRLAMVLT